MHRNSRLIFAKYAPQYFKNGMRVLEIAPDADPSTYRRLVSAAVTWDTLDVAAFVTPSYASSLTYAVHDPYKYPIADGVYDAVVSGNVIEHVSRPWAWVREISRICSPGGYVITVNPTNWIYHQAPLDCWRIYPDGMRALYEEAGLEMVFSTFESVERQYIPVLRTLRQLARLATFRKPNFIMGEVLDTISIGRKLG